MVLVINNVVDMVVVVAVTVGGRRVGIDHVPSRVLLDDYAVLLRYVCVLFLHIMIEFGCSANRTFVTDMLFV